MASLVGQQLKDTYDSLLKVDDNGSLGGTYKEITDGLGNGSNLYLGTGGRVGIGDSTPSLALSISGDGIDLNGVSVYPTIKLRSSSQTTSTFEVKQGTGANPTFTVSDARNFIFESNSNERMRIGSGGDISFRDGSANEAFYWDASTARLGIGTTSPAGTLNVTDGNDGLEIGNEGVTGTTRIFAYDRTANNEINLIQRALTHQFQTNAQERMRIDSSGNVLVGMTTYSTTDDGHYLGANGMLFSQADGLSAGTFSRLTNDGDIVRFRKDGTTVGSIASVATGKVGFFGSGGSGAVIDSSGNVGIGTDNPDTILELDGDTSYEHLKISASGNTSRFMKIGMDSATEHTIEASGPQCFLTFKTGATPTEQVRIDSSGNVGIGQTNPSSHKLHVASSASFAPLAIFENTGSGQSLVQIKSPSASILEFGDNDDGNVGAIQYYHSDNTMRFKTNDSEKMRIDSSGDVLVKTNDARIGSDVGSVEYGTSTNNSVKFFQNNQERMRIDISGNVLIGTTATPTSSAGNIVLKNGTAPTGNATDGVILYAEDVSTSSELKVRDEAGNVTTLSPHNFSLIPDGASEPMAWAYYSERDGKKINVDMLKLARMVESLTGEKLVYEQ